MNVLIVEDETLAADRLESLIHKHDPGIDVKSRIDTVKDSIEYLTDNIDELDLIFMDIQLADGKSLEIFKQIEVDKPIIFTTAYDEYSLEAFKFNSIHYLLKPIKYKDLSEAIDKYGKYHQQNSDLKATSEKLIGLLQSNQTQRKSRFLLKYGNRLVSEPYSNIGVFYIQEKVVYCKLFNDDKNYLIDHSMEELETLLTPDQFFRVNRKAIVNIDAVRSIIPYKNHRLQILSNPSINEEIIVSREKVNSFRSWLSA